MEEQTQRIERLERDVRTTQDSVLLIHSDLQQMSQSMAKMAGAMEKLAEIQNKQVVMEERLETRHKDQKEVNILLHSRIDKVDAKCEKLEPMAERGLESHKTLMFIAKTLGGLVLALLFTMFIWLVKQGAGD